MKKNTKSIILAASALALSSTMASAHPESEQAQIERVLETYETALNASDTEMVMTVYQPDGVFMPQHSPSAVGTEEVRTAYNRVFEAIKLEVEFDVQEIVQIAPEWAFARTNSAGFVTVNATGDRVPEANQELFIFQKDEQAGWRIARYSFSTTNPPRQ